jgi:hypothetical protein
MSNPKILENLLKEAGELSDSERRRITINVLPAMVIRWDELVKEGKCTIEDGWKKIVELAKSIK